MKKLIGPVIGLGIGFFLAGFASWLTLLLAANNELLIASIGKMIVGGVLIIIGLLLDILNLLKTERERQQET